jgi:chromosome segregation ATPase
MAGLEVLSPAQRAARHRDGMRRIAELEAANARLEADLTNAKNYLRAAHRRVNDLEKERAFLQGRVDELEALQGRHEGAVHAAYFAAWNECTQQMEKAAYAARNANPETILNLMGEHA